MQLATSSQGTRAIPPRKPDDFGYPHVDFVSVDRGGTAEAWIQFHVRASDDSNFMATIAKKINDLSPSADGVFGALSGGNDFYFWVRKNSPANQALNWSIYPLNIQGSWQDSILAEMTAEDVTTKLLGFNEGSRSMWMMYGKK